MLWPVTTRVVYVVVNDNTDVFYVVVSDNTDVVYVVVNDSTCVVYVVINDSTGVVYVVVNDNTDVVYVVVSYLDNTDYQCTRKLRMGKVGDGGWEVCDDYQYRPIKPCIVYSFG